MTQARIGMMQGRLVPPVRGIQAFPRERWQEEFPAAAEAGLAFIEWIFDEYGADVNPLMTASGVEQIRAACDGSGVAVESICADYFMDWPLLKCTPQEHETRMGVFSTLMKQAKMLGVKRVVLPFVDASALSSAEEEAAFVDLMHRRVLPLAERMHIEIHLETSLPPAGVAQLLAQIPHHLFWINYDSGNSASLGYKPLDEFQAYGARIGSFHVKDRVLGGTTVHLGTGNTDFGGLAACLRDIHYRRSFVLQVARGEPGDEIAWARHNREYTQTHLTAAL